jgi:hypothetical protein
MGILVIIIIFGVSFIFPVRFWTWLVCEEAFVLLQIEKNNQTFFYILSENIFDVKNEKFKKMFYILKLMIWKSTNNWFVIFENLILFKLLLPPTEQMGH